jgi:hypothetical protein
LKIGIHLILDLMLAGLSW